MVGVFSVGLKAGSRKPDLFLAPDVQNVEREKALSFVKDKYKALHIIFIAEYEIQFVDATHASVEANVKWATDQVEVERRALVRFEKVDGDWYFENFDFLWLPQTSISANFVLILATLMAALIGLGLGMRHLKRRRSA